MNPLENPMKVLKVRQLCPLELYALKVFKRRKSMTESDFINRMTDKGFKKIRAQEMVVTLINSHDVKRTAEGLEYIEWKL